MVKEDLKRVRCKVGEVVGGELFKSRDEVVRGALVDGRIFVGFELMLSRKDIHDYRENPGDRFEDDHEKDETSRDGCL